MIDYTRGRDALIRDLREELEKQQNRGATLHEALDGMRETIRRLEDTIERYRAAGYGWPE